MKRLIISSSQRTGSTLVALLLHDCGAIAGGLEFFEGYVMPDDILPQLGINSVAEVEADVDRYVERIQQHWAPANGQFFATKVHWYQFEYWSAHGLDLVKHFPGARYIHCTRGDLVKQAISAVKANQTKSWTYRQQPRHAPVYQFEEIAQQIATLARERSQWEHHFSSNGIQPFRLAYETLDRDHRQVMRHLTAWLGLRPSRLQLARLRMRLKRQSDDTNSEWEARYYADLGKTTERSR